MSLSSESKLCLISYHLLNYLTHKLYHSLNGSSDSVNGDLQFLWDRQISTPYKINTPEPIDKKLGTVDYLREGTSYTKFGTNPPTEGFWANG